MIHGVPISRLREAAKGRVQNHFVDIAESDGTPPTLRAMYVLKLQEAKRVLAGEPSQMIEEEAELRGLTPIEMATAISNMADQSRELEIARMRVNVQIEEAKSEGEIVKILEGFGLSLYLKAEK